MTKRENIVNDIIEIKNRLNYDPNTGIFTWINPPRSLEKDSRLYNSWCSRCINKRAGKVYKKKEDKTSYRAITLNGKTIKEHRIAFVIMNNRFPTDYIDHINGDGTDNRWDNLREVDSLESSKNLPKRSTNISGVVGVGWNKRLGKWVARITVNNKHIHLGYFYNFQDAVERRKCAEIQHGFHENHGR